MSELPASTPPGAAARASDVRIVFGNAPGVSLRVKFADLKVVSTDGHVKVGQVEVFTGRGAICFSEQRTSGRKTNRFFIIEPALSTTVYPTQEGQLGPFRIEGKFKISETENDGGRAAKAFAAFEAS